MQVKDDGTTIKAMPRGALRVRVRANGHKVDSVACHLKSKLLSFRGGRFQPSDEKERARYAGYALDQRATEAVTVRAYANTLLDGHGTKRAVIVVGDLNDGPLAATTEIRLGPPGSEIGTHGFDHPDAGDNWRLWNLAPLIPKVHLYTREAEGQRELIDHILVSRGLLGNGGVTIDTGGPEPPAIGAVPTARRDEPASDHSPLFARFQLGD